MRGHGVCGLCFFAGKLLQDARSGEAMRGHCVFGLCFFEGKLLQDARTAEAMRGRVWQPPVTWDRQKKKNRLILKPKP